MTRSKSLLIGTAAILSLTISAPTWAAEKSEFHGTTTAAPAARAADRRFAGFAPGTVFRECDTCPEMVIVPAGGSIKMGGGALRPPYEVTFSKPFALGKTEVTFAAWEACVAAGACTHKPSDYEWGRENRPVIDVSWQDAQQYAAWLSQKTGATYRLPTQAEWTYAARAGRTTMPSSPGELGLYKVNANCYACPAPVASFAANPWGLYDMGGNVSEWVEDIFRKTCTAQNVRFGCNEEDRHPAAGNSFADRSDPYTPLDASPPAALPPAAPLRVVVPEKNIAFPSDFRKISIGIRIARTLD